MKTIPNCHQRPELWRDGDRTGCFAYGPDHVWNHIRSLQAYVTALEAEPRCHRSRSDVGCRMCDMVERTGTHVSKRQEQIHNAMHRTLRPQAKPKRKAP